MAPMLFWQSLIGLTAMASVLGVGCYATCRFLRPHPGIGLLLTGLLAFFSLGTTTGFILVFPVSYLCSRCGVELHRKTKPEDDVERSQGIIFTATAITIMMGVLGGVPYLSDLSFYAPQEAAVQKIATVYMTLLAVTPSLAPLLWICHSNKRPQNLKETNNELASFS